MKLFKSIVAFIVGLFGFKKKADVATSLPPFVSNEELRQEDPYNEFQSKVLEAVEFVQKSVQRDISEKVDYAFSDSMRSVGIPFYWGDCKDGLVERYHIFITACGDAQEGEILITLERNDTHEEYSWLYGDDVGQLIGIKKITSRLNAPHSISTDRRFIKHDSDPCQNPFEDDYQSDCRCGGAGGCFECNPGMFIDGVVIRN